MSNWEWKKLGDVCEFQGGAQPPKEEWIKENRSGYIRMLQIRDFTQSRNFDIEYVKKTSKLRICNENDILLGRYGASVGKVLTGLSGAYNVAIVKTIPNSEYSKLFIKYYFQSPLFQTRLLNLCNQRTAQAGFNKEDIYDFPIPYISLNEQKHVVKTLDEKFAKIDKLKTAAETNLKNAKELFETTLEKELNPLSRHSERSEESSADLPSGWELKTLQEICGKIVDGTHNSPPNKAKGDYQYITAKNIKADGIDLSDVTYVSKEVHKEIFARCNPEKGDVLLIKDGATTGIAVINTLDYEFSLLSSVALIKVDKTKIYEKTLVYLLNSKAIYKQMRKKMDGAAITRLTLEKIKALQIPLPPLSVQKEIVARLDKLSENVKRLEANYKQIIANCDELKKSILKKTFEGDSRSSRE